MIKKKLLISIILFFLTLICWTENPAENNEIIYAGLRRSSYGYESKNKYEWGDNYKKSIVGFQFGYLSDKKWWGKLKNPERSSLKKF